ncbi:MAG: SO2930 family diheme c-type cytochrome [Bacteroidota bacterium]
MKYLLSLLLLLLVGSAFRPAAPQGPAMTLSEYGFFKGEVSALVPAEGVLPYQLNTPLFSDYSEKLRYIKLPKGATVPYNDQEVLHFPVGTTIIKTFYYPVDARKPEKGRQLMETRLLIHEDKGWKALAYHWNEEQTEAFLEVAGGTKEVKWINKKGKKQKLEYAFPNLNQCKGCHSFDGKLRPIGPSARQLNGNLDFGQGPENQLEHWAAANMIAEMPAIAEVPKAAVWNDPTTGSLDQRARIWLDINCAHCHNEHGPASTSGFFLDVHQTEPIVWGVNKAPVAAGRGSGGRSYDIVPAKPEESILYFRLNSTDPGIMMPEVGRKVLHSESLDLIHEWISAMDPADY